MSAVVVEVQPANYHIILQVANDRSGIGAWPLSTWELLFSPLCIHAGRS